MSAYSRAQATILRRKVAKADLLGHPHGSTIIPPMPPMNRSPNARSLLNGRRINVHHIRDQFPFYVVSDKHYHAATNRRRLVVYFQRHL